MKSTAGRALFSSLLLFGTLTTLTPRASAQGGMALWTNYYGGKANENDYTTGMAVDGNGNVFVTGYSTNSGTGNDYATVAYSSVGVPLWTNRYNRSTNGNDRAKAVAVNRNGNVLVTGTGATVAYSTLGVPLWTNAYNGIASAVAVNTNDHVLVTGTSPGMFQDYATVAYSSTGIPLWTNRYRGQGYWSSAYAVATDNSGNVFVTGESTGLGDTYDYATVAYSNAGVPLWTNRYSNPRPGSDDHACAIALDMTGNVFVTGYSVDPLFGPSFTTVKYSNDGSKLWANQYGVPWMFSARARALVLDKSGNAFVTGYLVAGAGDSDFATVAYSDSGTLLWTNRYNGPANGSDDACAVATDSSDNVIVAGTSLGSGSGLDYAVVAYTSAGVPLWTNRYDGIGNSNDVVTAIGVDNTGSVFVTGYSWSGSDYDYVTIKYSSSVPPVRLNYRKTNNQLVLSWTNAGFSLQTAPASTGTFTNLPDATSPYTNPIIAAQQFFRLKKN